MENNQEKVSLEGDHKMDILIVCNYWHFEFEKKNSRYRTMADILSNHDGFNVEVVTSSFRHQTKQQRDPSMIKEIRSSYKITLLYEPNYKTNISFQRLISHHVLAKNIKNYLIRRNRPDIIICSVPSLSVGSVVTQFAKQNDIPVIIDIQDLWPEAFKMAIDIPLISSFLFYPMLVQANNIYASADAIMGVSNTYVNRGLEVNKGAKRLPLYIGTDYDLVQKSVESHAIMKPQNEFWIGYSGALGYSYDITSIIDAIKLLSERGYSDIVFKIMGDGILKDEFEKYANKQMVKCDFTGFLDYGEMMATLMCCDIAVNPIVGNSAASIINKVSDYAAAGVPVINTQNSEEYRNLIKEYSCGINCENGNIESIANGIRKLHDDSALRQEMGVNSKRLGEQLFNRQKTYPKVISLIEEFRRS